MAVAAEPAELELTPSLDEVRALAREHSLVPLRHTFIADCETPVSAYLKLRGEAPSFLLESAEQGQRFGRWSFLGFRPRSVIRMQDGRLTVDGDEREAADPYGLVADELARWRSAPLEGLPPFAGGAVGLFGYDLVRAAEPTVGEPNPDDIGMPDLALMVTDVLVAFDHLRHEVTVLANVVAGDDVDASYRDAAQTIADVRERLAGPVPRTRAGTPRARGLQLEHGGGGLRRAPSSARRSTSARATPTRWCRASAGAPTARSRRSRSTAACAPSTRAPTCTSSTSWTSRSRAPRPRRS